MRPDNPSGAPGTVAGSRPTTLPRTRAGPPRRGISTGSAGNRSSGTSPAASITAALQLAFSRSIVATPAATRASRREPADPRAQLRCRQRAVVDAQLQVWIEKLEIAAHGARELQRAVGGEAGIGRRVPRERRQVGARVELKCALPRARVQRQHARDRQRRVLRGHRQALDRQALVGERQHGRSIDREGLPVPRALERLDGRASPTRVSDCVRLPEAVAVALTRPSSGVWSVRGNAARSRLATRASTATGIRLDEVGGRVRREPKTGG